MSRSDARRHVVKGVDDPLDRFKYEVADELGLGVRPGDDWGDLPARQCGRVGGEMVRRMIRIAEESIDEDR